MSDFVGGIKQIGPAYPVRPVQPSQKDRETGQRRNKRQPPQGGGIPEPEPGTATDDDDPKRTIDEHI